MIRSLPKPNATELPAKFLREERRELPIAGLATIPNGRVVTSSGAIIAPPDCLIAEDSYGYLDPRNNPIFLTAKLPPITRREGGVAVLTLRSSNNYFHWLFDSLPRLKLLRESKVKYSWLVAPRQTGFQIQTFEHIDLDGVSIIDAPTLQIEADTLIVPTLPGLSGNPPKWVCNFLRDTFLRGDQRHVRTERKIYVSRSKAGTRKVLNESELLSALAHEGFERLTLENFSLDEQINIFSQAQVVIAPHGAGLSNLVFCQKGTAVVELFSPNYINVVYWALANQVGLIYDFVLGESSIASGASSCVHDNLKVDVGKVLGALRRVTFLVTQNC